MKKLFAPTTRVFLPLLFVAALFINCTTTNISKYARQEISLNGIWDFYPNGDAQRFDIRVPSFWDAPQDYDYPKEWLHMRHGIYKKTVAIPGNMAGKQVFLKIKRVSVLAKLYVNGQHVGGETSGGYLMMQLPYLVDITSAAKTGEENMIEVRVWGGQSLIHGVNNSLKDEQDFPADVFDGGKLLYPWCVDHYDGRRGINGDVLLIARPKTYISDIFVIPDLNKNTDPQDDKITIRVTVTNKDTAVKILTVTNVAALLSGTGQKSFPNRQITVQPDSSAEITITDVSWPDAQYWWPHDPKLYTLKTVLTDGKTVTDQLNTRFGFRQFYINGNHYELNGIRANLRGDAYEFSWHEGYRHGPSTAPVLSTKELTIDVQKRLLNEYKNLNFNFLRPHKASGIDETYDHCDEIGLLVMDEAPMWQLQQRTDARAKNNFQDWVRRWIAERKNHPSIVAWIIANESWSSPIPQFNYEAAKAADPSRPVFHQGVIANDFEGDAQVVHYTGGYPMRVFNTADLYDIYTNNPDKPKGEGEALFAEGWPLKNEDGSLSQNRSERGDYNNPDMLSQAEWVRGVSRFLRAMRFAELADSRLYADWMYSFEVIEDDIRPDWPDLSAPGLKPTVLHRPICNTFTDKYPEIIKGDGYTYMRHSVSPVAVFDLEHDANNLLGVNPVVYNPGDKLERKVAIYNDEFTDGATVSVDWEAGSLNPSDDAYIQITAGSFDVTVPYGGEKTGKIDFTIPEDVSGARWLVLKLSGIKNNKIKFVEQNRLGVINSIPEPLLTIEAEEIDLGGLAAGLLTQLKKIKLINKGGGLSEKWTASGTDNVISLNRSSGNLRGEEEIYYRINTTGLAPGRNYIKKLFFTGEHGSTDSILIHFYIE